jgi:hypothetical protein
MNCAPAFQRSENRRRIMRIQKTMRRFAKNAGRSSKTLPDSRLQWFNAGEVLSQLIIGWPRERTTAAMEKHALRTRMERLYAPIHCRSEMVRRSGETPPNPRACRSCRSHKTTSRRYLAVLGFDESPTTLQALSRAKDCNRRRRIWTSAESCFPEMSRNLCKSLKGWGIVDVHGFHLDTRRWAHIKLFDSPLLLKGFFTFP